MKSIIRAAFVASVAAFELDVNHLSEVHAVAPKLASMMKRAVVDGEALANELAASPIAQMAPEIGQSTPKEGVDTLPIVVTHGMGDSCFNPGMKSITAAAGTHKGVYSVCVPGGDNKISDTLSGFFTTMDKNVDIFAAKVAADPKLTGGFDAIGLSQGNSVIRGYIQRYNTPPVRNYLSVHGTVMGVSGFPNCNPADPNFPNGICDIIAESLGPLAYTGLIQKSLFQANYFRDPKRWNTSEYFKNSQIAQWNNENPANVNATLKTNFEAVHSYSMVKAMKDTMVFPNAGEWWGEFADDNFKSTVAMKDTPLYKNNNFGLQTVDQAMKIRFNSTDGEHLQFTVQQLDAWIDLYFN